MRIAIRWAQDKMTMERKFLSIRERIIAFLGYIVLLLGLQYWITGNLVHLDIWDKNVLLIAGLLFFAFHLFDAPFFRTPSNSFPNALGAGLSLIAADIAGNSDTAVIAENFRTIGIVLAAIAFSSSLLAMWYDKRRATAGKPEIFLDVAGFRLSSELGRGEILFSFPAIVSTLSNYGSLISTSTLLITVWFLLIRIKPVELLIRLSRVLAMWRLGAGKHESIGTILRIDHPNIVRVRIDSNRKWTSEFKIYGHLPSGERVRLLPLFSHLQNDRIIGSALAIDTATAPRMITSPGDVVLYQDDAQTSLNEDTEIELLRDSTIAGTVCEDSRIDTLHFELAPDVNLHEGSIVHLGSGSNRVYYQVLDAKTAEESFEGDPRGKTVVFATQLGSLLNGQFRKYDWLHEMNAPVLTPKTPISNSDYTPTQSEIKLGALINTKLDIFLDLNDAITYHTAILGMTGKGKTELALDVVKAASLGGAKVFCVDFTGEYRARLAEVNPTSLELDETKTKELDEKLFAVDSGEFKAGKEKIALKQFTEGIIEDVRKSVDGFLRPEGGAIGVFELPEITNTKAMLRATELYLSCIMEWAKTHRQARQILVVLEEAHTIIPESSGSGFDFDTQWIVGRIAQIALQGRKYGVGLLLMSQRTALVSKSVLSQCGTYITFGLVDKTSLDYLTNVYSAEHVAIIPNLPARRALVFGKALKCERPVLIEVPFDQAKLEASEALAIKLKVAPQGTDVAEVETGDENLDNVDVADEQYETRLTTT